LDSMRKANLTSLISVYILFILSATKDLPLLAHPILL
jgi:hypothetical protein